MNEEWEPADFVSATGKRVVKVVTEDGWPTVGVVDFDKATLSADGENIRYEYTLSVSPEMSRAERETREGGAA